MAGRIIWSSMVWPAYVTIMNIPLIIIFWPETFSLGESNFFNLSLVAGWWAGTLLVCGAFWRSDWRRSTAEQLYLWGIFGIVGTVLLFAMVIVDVIPLPPRSGWLYVFWTTFGLSLSAATTAMHIASRLRKENRNR